MYEMVIFFTFFISFKYDFYVDAESMIVRKRETPIISANIFDFTARILFRTEDLSIFVDHMINFFKVAHNHCFFTLVSTNSEKWVVPVVWFCICYVLCCALLCVHSGFSITLMGREELVALVSLSSCVSWLLCYSSSRCHGFVRSL